MIQRRQYGALPERIGAALDALYLEGMACTACPLHKTRDRVAIYRGAGVPRILFIGEAPGTTENRIGLPFVGKAGEILDDRIMEIGLRDFGILNVVNCQPIGNDLQPGSIEACSPFLRRKLDLLGPYVEILVLLGRKPERTVTANYLATLNKSPRFILPILHPAALLHYRSAQFVERWNAQWRELRAKALSLGIIQGFKLLPVSGDKEKK